MNFNKNEFFIIDFKVKTIFALSIAFMFSLNSLVAQIPVEAADSDRIAAEGESKVKEAIEAVEKAEREKQKEESVRTRPEEGHSAENTNVTDTEGQSQPVGIIYNDGRMNYANSQTKFELTASDQISDVDFIEYRINDAPLQRYNGPFSIEQEGLHRIVYRGVDRAGNREAEQVYPVIIDNTAPAVSAVTNKPVVERFSKVYVGPETSLELRAVDALSGVKKIEYSVNGAEVQEYSAAIPLNNEGEQMIKFKATDFLGNQSAEKSFMAELDATKPVVTITPSHRMVNYDGKKYALRKTIFTVAGTDAQSGIETLLIKVDGETEFRKYTQPLNFSVEGEHAIEAKAIDRVGNESEVVTLEFITDDNPPRTTIRPIAE